MRDVRVDLHLTNPNEKIQNPRSRSAQATALRDVDSIFVDSSNLPWFERWNRCDGNFVIDWGIASLPLQSHNKSSELINKWWSLNPVHHVATWTLTWRIWQLCGRHTQLRTQRHTECAISRIENAPADGRSSADATATSPVINQPFLWLTMVDNGWPN